MDALFILAKTVVTSEELAPETPLIPLDSIWDQITALTWLQAIIAISFGVVYLLYGWRIFRILVVICFGIVGLFAGITIGANFDLEVVGGITGLLVLGILAVPLMRWAVSLLGAVAGGILTAGIWYAFELPGKYILAGAIIGIVAGGMISFIIFKIAIMLFTSLGGGILITAGTISLLHQYEKIQSPPTGTIRDLFFNHNWFLPAMLLLTTAIGIALQNRFVKGSKEWDI
jgi:hypothetical protein